MAGRQTLAILLVAMLAAASVSSQGLDCWNKDNCYLCQYCSRRNECGQSNLDSDHQKLCGCQSQCDFNCGAFCPNAAGRRLLLEGRTLKSMVEA